VITDDPTKIDETFEYSYNSGLYSKVVKPSELINCVSITTYGIIQGEKVQILQEREDRYQVGTGSLLVGSRINLPRVDRDTWLGWVFR